MPLDPSTIPVQAFYGIRSERQLMEQLDNHLYCRFVRLSPDDPVWDPTSLMKNPERLQNGNLFTKLMNKSHPQIQVAIVGRAFSVDGTLIEAWASQKSIRPKDGSDDGDAANFHRQKRKNDTHASSSDRKALPHGPRHHREPAWAGMLILANGTAERRSSEGMLKIKVKVTASLPVRTKPMIRPIMRPIFAPST